MKETELLREVEFELEKTKDEEKLWRSQYLDFKSDYYKGYLDAMQKVKSWIARGA